MRSMRTVALVPLLAIAALALPGAQAIRDQKPIQIGALRSLFQDVAEAKQKELTESFGTLLRKHTGLTGEVHTIANAFDLADQLDKGKLDLGLFHGVELAWVQKKHPKVRPLMVAVEKRPYLHVLLVTAKKNKVASFDELKGKVLSLPERSSEPCHLFLERHAEKASSTPDKFFSKIVRPASIEDALDDVVRGKVDAIVVDDLSMENYGIVRPGAVPLLRTIEKTPAFPPAAVVYREGKLGQKTLDTFHKGMLEANKDPESRGQMSLWKVTAFQAIPDDYQQHLDKIRKAYPPPMAEASSK